MYFFSFIVFILTLTACYLLFSHISSRTVGLQQNGDNDAHQQQDGHVEPQCLDRVGTDDFLTAVERSAAYLAAWCQEDDAGTGYDAVVNDIQHPLLVGTDDAVFQFGVVVVAFQLQQGILAVLADEC